MALGLSVSPIWLAASRLPGAWQHLLVLQPIEILTFLEGVIEWLTKCLPCCLLTSGNILLSLRNLTHGPFNWQPQPSPRLANEALQSPIN